MRAGLKDIRIEFAYAYVPPPYKAEAFNFGVSIGGQ